MEKPTISFFITNLSLLFAVIGFIFVVFDLHRFAFVSELMLLLIFVFLLAFSMSAIYRNKKWGWTILGAVLVLLLINAVFIALLTKIFETAHMTIIFFSVVGLVVTLFNLKESMEESDNIKTEEQYEKTGYAPYIDKIEPEEEVKTEEQEAKIKKTFMPGKFVASKKSNKFHSPKCDWAKMINKPNQLWFTSREEAEGKGFEADRCVS